MNRSALGHGDKGGEKNNDENIITGCSCHDHLRDAFICTVPLLHELNHPWDYHRRRNSAQYSAHDSGFYPCNSQNMGCKIRNPKISKLAGTQAIITAGRPPVLNLPD